MQKNVKPLGTLFVCLSVRLRKINCRTKATLTSRSISRAFSWLTLFGVEVTLIWWPLNKIQTIVNAIGSPNNIDYIDLCPKTAFNERFTLLGTLSVVHITSFEPSQILLNCSGTPPTLSHSSVQDENRWHRSIFVGQPISFSSWESLHYVSAIFSSNARL